MSETHTASRAGVVPNALDPCGIMASQWQVSWAWLNHPQALWQAGLDFSGDLVALNDHCLRRLTGIPVDDLRARKPGDERFADPIWTESPTCDIFKEWYLVLSNRLQSFTLETPGLSDHERRRAAFWQRNWLNSLAPTNFFWLNPQAIARAIGTQGESVVQGWKNFLRDLEARNILMVEPDAFVVGKDLATSAGKVIYRNRLVELIHYAPTTAKVREMPVLILTPWINKFYVLDLTARKSLVKYLTDQGFSVFISSWKNPTQEMRDLRFDDYLLEGAHELVKVTADFCQVKQVHLVGYCIGGTLAAAYLAWANKRFGPDQMPVAHWTLLTTLVDFNNPGEIDAFIDEACIAAIEDAMAIKGYLDGNEMTTSFRLLRSNTLIWNYWVQSYLLGEKLPAFDVLFWNIDSTRMPRAMHSFYLREMYLKNKLVQPDALTLAGEMINLERIQQPLYAVTAEDDHIAPWKSCYQIRQNVAAQTPVRFVRSTSGHILGIVNPPVQPPKRAYWVAHPERDEDPEHWLGRAEFFPGTWWEDWIRWLGERTGKQVKVYPASNRRYPALADAPGVYVMEK